MPSNFITIAHPELGEAEIVESSLPVWEDKGWKRVERKEPKPDSAVEAATFSSDTSQTEPVSGKSGKSAK